MNEKYVGTIVHKSIPLKKFCSLKYIADVSKIQAYLYEEVY